MRRQKQNGILQHLSGKSIDKLETNKKYAYQPQWLPPRSKQIAQCRFSRTPGEWLAVRLAIWLGCTQCLLIISVIHKKLAESWKHSNENFFFGSPFCPGFPNKVSVNHRGAGGDCVWVSKSSTTVSVSVIRFSGDFGSKEMCSRGRFAYSGNSILRCIRIEKFEVWRWRGRALLGEAGVSRFARKRLDRAFAATSSFYVSPMKYEVADSQIRYHSENICMILNVIKLCWWCFCIAQALSLGNKILQVNRLFSYFSIAFTETCQRLNLISCRYLHEHCAVTLKISVWD